ncbi:MAG: energy transducer TonB [Alcanivoracaceae bacterium]|nr:energy transducer TonB [Alcanivoracaceae bacterium]
MKKKEKYIRFFSGFVSMLIGTTIVLSIVILINDSQFERNEVNNKLGAQIKFERKKPKSKQMVKRHKPKPKPKRTKRAAPAPIMGLNSQLSGIDLGLPEFSLDDLNDLDSNILGNGNGIVMTDDTVDSSPKATFQSPATYPARARAKGLEGYVVFSLLIGITGEIEQVKIVESIPEGIFDDAATQSMQAWKFEPAQYQGQPVKTWAKQRIRFDLS